MAAEKLLRGLAGLEMDDVPPVQFDFDGALELARAMWDTAESFETVSARRTDDAELALTEWTGPDADRFRSELFRERRIIKSMAGDLRQAAESWASAWARATRAQEQRQLEGVDFPGQRPEPTRPPIPTGPNFWPTN